jgi:Na+-translocating ferredoxin:NAD+ oxidoreductase RnfD subunit
MTPAPAGCTHPANMPCASCLADAKPGWPGYAWRVLASGALVAAYYAVRGPLGEAVGSASSKVTGGEVDLSATKVFTVALLLAALYLVWRKIVSREPKFSAPLLITVILALSDASYHVLENHPAPPWLVEFTNGAVLEYSPTFLTITVTLLTELLIGRFFYGKWPNLTSAYISGISAGILIKSPALWPFLLCGMISITSKYVLRVYNRHLWNPTNFGVTMMLFLAPQHVASLSVQAGNNGLAIALIWFVGGLIMYKLGRFHIPLAFIATFIPLAFLRSSVTGHPWQTEIAPITSPMFQLYIFFMITDPPTTTRKKWSQALVAVLVAGMETFWRLAFKDVHSLYHALFTVGPISNLVEILVLRAQTRAAQRKLAGGFAHDAKEKAMA